jgi:hypothetical protein
VLILILTLLLAATPAAAQSGGDAFVTISDAPDPVTAGEEITLTITIGSGAGTATKVQLQSPVPAQTAPVSATPSGPGATCEAVAPSTTVFKCDLGTIPAATTKSVTIVVRSADSATGTVASQATVSAENDPNQANNTAGTQTTITSAPPSGDKPPPSDEILEDSPLIPEDTTPLPPNAFGQDEEPPGQVSRVRATPRDRSVALRWRLPSDPDLAHVVITRSAVNVRDRVVYRGRAVDFVDRGLRNGTLYVYELRTEDRSGNTSDGVWVTARPRGAPLFSPRANARLSSPPVLRWVAVPRALYYNVQLFRGSRKVLSAWPRGNQFELRSQWHYAGRRERLLPGTYHWFVWPGRGPRSRSNYSPLLGRSSFVIVPPT